MVTSSGLLATARIIIQSPSEEKLEVRALIDPCAERSFISERIVQSLSLENHKVSQDVCFLGGKSRITVKKEAKLIISSKLQSDFRLVYHALILTELTRVLLANRITHCSWSHIDKLTLADPAFTRPQKVDCVLEADIYSETMLPSLKKGPKNTPVAQNTVFGWILTGATGAPVNKSEASNAFHVTVDTSLSKQLQRFWEAEEVPWDSQSFSPDDQYCEEYFKSTISRSSDGRLIVLLPFTQSINAHSFPEPRDIAVACLLRSERRRLRNPTMDIAYCKFMKDYEDLDHMERIEVSDLPESAVYLTHHAVFRKESNKIRVIKNMVMVIVSMIFYLLVSNSEQISPSFYRDGDFFVSLS